MARLLAAALVAGLGWAWWPDGDRYQPVRAYEGGTLLDVLPAAQGSDAGLVEGQAGTATTIWPAEAGDLPTAAEPVLALVMAPAGTGAGGKGEDGAGSTAPTWVFPFDRPLPPGAGDNQALTVNTEDGSIAYDVSFALVWADGDTALNRNEAYAFASCTGCRTVAVAFQVVLLVGSVDVVVPENLSAAVNYGCVECVTYALATQLVLTVPGELSEQGTRELAAVWAELQAFGEGITDVPLSELRARLTEFEQRISAVVRSEGQDAVPAQEAGAPDEGAATPSSTGGSSRGAAPTGSSPAGATAERTPEAAPTRSSASSTSSAAVSTTPSSASTSAAPSSAGTTPATGSGTTAPGG